jgi:hypothetical protein
MAGRILVVECHGAIGIRDLVFERFDQPQVRDDGVTKIKGGD